MSTSYEILIKDNHCGYNKTLDYKKIVYTHPITEIDLDYFYTTIQTSLVGGQSNYDQFPDNGVLI